MKTLLIDSSRKSLSIALSSENKLLFVSSVESYSRHSNFLMKEIINVLNKNNITIYDIDNFVVLNGPGSFTGLRVGVTITKTLAWVLGKKAYQLSNLEALAIQANDEVVLSVINDKDNSSYVGIYDGLLKEEGYFTIDEVANIIKNKKVTITSLENSTFLSTLKNNLSINNEVSVNIIENYDYLKVINYALEHENVNPHLLEPVYLKKIDAEKNKK